jgi:hypothetical protein
MTMAAIDRGAPYVSIRELNADDNRSRAAQERPEQKGGPRPWNCLSNCRRFVDEPCSQS